MHALLFEEFGGPDVLKYRELPDPRVRDGHVLIEVKASGLNFADLYRRRGNYREMGTPPYINGYEGAGVVTAVGGGVTDFKVDDRIGFFDVARANVTKLNVPADRAVPIPETVSFANAASVLLQGLTAQYLCNASAPVTAGDWVVIHSAAGGVGRHLVRFCKAKGARVIAMASTAAKREIAAELGADITLSYEGNWVEEIQNRTERGAHIVFDGVGSTLGESIAAARTRGVIVAFGMSDKNPQPVDPMNLMSKSKALVGGELWDHLTSASDRASRSAELFAALKKGTLQFPPIEKFALADGAEAHRRLEDRSFSGKVVLMP